MGSEKLFETDYSCEVEVVDECREERYLELSVKFYGSCAICNDTEEVENPLTGEMHFCPICGEN